MKTTLPLRLALLLAISTIFTTQISWAQCNVNSQYDKIVSGYHASIAQRTDGSFVTWGAAMKFDGTDQGSPLSLDSTIYTAMRGTPLKVAIGGGAGGSQKDQAILLTTNGLYAWGIEGLVLNNSLTTSAAFAKIGSISGANSYGLPTGVNPSNVSSLFATSQTLLILTDSGKVYIMTQVNQTIEGNGSTGASGSSTWKQVKKDASTYLTNVTAVRGQVSSSVANAFMALTSDGKVYTWGNSVFLGDGNANVSKAYATQMTIPSEFASSIPKMIGVTGGISDSSAARNTYYLLANSGKLYSLGDNRLRQCGDFTTTMRTTWVQAKKSNSPVTYFTDVNFISVQEGNIGYPGMGAITTSGDLYTWGDNSSGMLGRATGGVAAGSWDPGIPLNFTSGTDKAIFCEMGGHTMLFMKIGSSKFCYVGHKTNGSMGDGTITSTSPSQTLTYDCNNTPSINICGYVPVSPDATRSAISSAQNILIGNGTTTTVVTVQLKDASGNNLTMSGGPVVIFTSLGTIGIVIDNNNGTYTAILTSPLIFTPSNTTLSYTINGGNGTNTANVDFTSFGLLSVSWKTNRANRVGRGVTVAWSTIEDENVDHYTVERSQDGVKWTPAIRKTKAQNLKSTNYYAETDTAYNASRIFYRIRQNGKDGDVSYSPIMQVAPDASGMREAITVYPFPASNSFKLGNVIPEKLARIQLFNMNGNLVKSWPLAQDGYMIQEIPRGMYLVKVEMKDGNIQLLRVSKN